MSRKPAARLTPEQAETSILGKPARVRLPVGHVSYSAAFSTYAECPKKYDLSYLMNAPKKGAVWFVGGLAVHRATEEWDRAQVAGRICDLPSIWRAVFNEELEKAKAKDPDILHWRKAGVKKDNEQGEDITHWYTVLGPKLVQAYVAWRQRSNWSIWTTPDGEPAIELDVGGKLPGMEVPFKGFIDRIFHDPTFDALRLVDLKTGTRKPETGLQLGVYAAATTHKYGVTVPTGAAFMNRQGHLSDGWSLEKYTPEYVGHNFQQVYQAIQAGYFVPKEGRHCGMCDVSAACYANNGPLAAEYDLDFPGNRPGF